MTAADALRQATRDADGTIPLSAVPRRTHITDSATVQQAIDSADDLALDPEAGCVHLVGGDQR